MDDPKNNPNESNSNKQFSYIKDPLTLSGAFRGTTMIDIRYSSKCPPSKPVILSKTQKSTHAPLSSPPEKKDLSFAKTTQTSEFKMKF